jgi:hypothetical protein
VHSSQRAQGCRELEAMLILVAHLEKQALMLKLKKKKARLTLLRHGGFGDFVAGLAALLRSDRDLPLGPRNSPSSYHLLLVH